jgi:hypothetical protein
MYLFLLLLAAVCSAVVNTITGHFDDSIFKKWNKTFWQPHETMGWNAVTVFSFGKLVLVLLSVVLAQFNFFQISFHSIGWPWQVLIAFGVYVLTVIVLLEFVFTTKKTNIHETI